MKTQSTSKILVATLAIAMTILACGQTNATEEAAVSVSIVTPADGSSANVGSEAQIISLSTAPDGISRLELAVNGQVVRTDIPTDGNPTTFTVVQTWIPGQEGTATISVVAYDINNIASVPATITINVQAGGGSGIPIVPSSLPDQPTYTPVATYTTAPTYTPQPTYTPLPTDTSIPSPTATMRVFIPLLPTFHVLLPPKTEQVYEQEYITSGSVGDVSVACPDGSVVVGGGYASSADMLVYTQSKNGNGWRVYAKNNAASSKLLNAYAVCLYNTGGTTEQILQQVSVAAGDIGHPVASCPSGSVVTGGGFASRSDGSFYVYNSSKSGNGWQVYARNNSGASIPLNVYAICLSGTTATSSDVYEQKSIPASSTDSAIATCPTGNLVTGGGFAAGNGLVLYTTNMKDNLSWQTYAKNTTGAGVLLNSYAICISFP